MVRVNRGNARDSNAGCGLGKVRVLTCLTTMLLRYISIRRLIPVAVAIIITLPACVLPICVGTEPPVRAVAAASAARMGHSIHPASSPCESHAASCALPNNSFVPGTLVLLADGVAVPIESLQVGDEVLATDPVTGETTGEPVVATITGTGVVAPRVHRRLG